MDDVTDERILRRTFHLAKIAKNRGNGAFGAILAEGKNVLLEAENTVAEGHGDPTCHAEMNVLREACKHYDKEDFSRFTLYCSSEPCLLGSGALYHCGVGRVVFGCSSEDFDQTRGLEMTCREILTKAGTRITGPLLQTEALALHASDPK